MSHLTTYKNNSLVNTNKGLLETALAEKGYSLNFDKKEIKSPYTRNWTEEQKKVDAILFQGSKELPIGLKFVTDAEGNETVEVAGDFWGTGINSTELTNEIAQIYQKHNVISKCRSQRWYVEDKNVVQKENGDIVIQAYRYA